MPEFVHVYLTKSNPYTCCTIETRIAVRKITKIVRHDAKETHSARYIAIRGVVNLNKNSRTEQI